MAMANDANDDGNSGNFATGKFYAGIGSRSIPEDILARMQVIAVVLAAQGWILRSGHAPGADQAFESGAEEAAEIYLPWPGFEKQTNIRAKVVSQRPSKAAMELAAQYHPGWKYLTRGARALHARNCHQILGPELDSKVAAVLCWTANGSVDGHERDTGGTGQALRLAAAFEIPVLNLARPADLERLERLERISELLRGTPDMESPRIGTHSDGTPQMGPNLFS